MIQSVLLIGLSLAAASPVEAYRKRIEPLMPAGWSIKANSDRLVVSTKASILIGQFLANPPALARSITAIQVDDKVYLPGKGDPEKTLYIDNPHPPDNYLQTDAPKTVPYHVFEPGLGQTALETDCGVDYRHVPCAIAIRFAPLVTDKEYRRMVEANKTAMARIDALNHELVARKVTHKFDSFLPDSPEEKKMIAERDRLKKNLRQLPQFHSDKQTVYIEDPLNQTNDPFTPGPLDPFYANSETAKPLHLLRRQIEQMFERYPAPK
jgi:hypothetical protein